MQVKLNVLMILNHAPDYRESFLRKLGKKVNLTVMAQPCEPDGLTPPDSRSGYKYYQRRSYKFLGFRWQYGLGEVFDTCSWDVICVSANLRDLSRIFLFLTNSRYRDRWVLWGHIFGRSKNILLNSVRSYFIRNSSACLVHGKSIAQRISKEYSVPAVSFNNSEINKDEFRIGKFSTQNVLKLLFVGRYQKRKRLGRLVSLASRRSDVQVRLVGPGMEAMSVPSDLLQSKRVQIYDRTTGRNLDPHFDWADIVANPGHVGLLVMNAARHGKGIVIDADSEHAPEYYLATDASQPFISFSENSAVDQFIDQVLKNPEQLYDWARALQDKARQEYTVESMVDTHLKVFETIINKKGSSN